MPFKTSCDFMLRDDVFLLFTVLLSPPTLPRPPPPANCCRSCVTVIC